MSSHIHREIVVLKLLDGISVLISSDLEYLKLAELEVFGGVISDIYHGPLCI
jgi:hypothetical protein